MKMSKRSKVSEFDIEQNRVKLVKDRVGQQVTIKEGKDMMGKEYIQTYHSNQVGGQSGLNSAALSEITRSVATRETAQ